MIITKYPEHIEAQLRIIDEQIAKIYEDELPKESNAEFVQRICASFEKVIDGCIKSGVQNIAIVSHAGVLMTILSCYGLPEAPMAHWQMDAGYGYKLRITPSLWMRGNKMEVVNTSPEELKKEEE